MGMFRITQMQNSSREKDGNITGDVFAQDGRGYLFFMERTDDMIISGGENIYPREIESVLYNHPGVAEVAVIGLPHVDLRH